MLKCMLPWPECVTCAGRGHYPTEDDPCDRICECDAGKMRREYDAGGDIHEITQRVRGRSRAEEWERYEWPDHEAPRLRATAST